MNRVILSGITGGSPLAALASFGLLRICQEIPELKGARLSWNYKENDGTALDEPVAVMHFSNTVDEGILVSTLVEHIASVNSEYFDWSDDIRVPPEKFTEMLNLHLKNSSLYERLWADMLSAFGSEIVVDRVKGMVKPTLFKMTAGQQRFLRSISEVRDSLKSKTDEAVREALFGPWLYKDPYHSLGWDPATERLHALRVEAPTKETPRCVRAAVYLAAESLPIFPTVVLPSRKLGTTGFTKNGDGNDAFVWPVWEPPIGVESLKSLLASSELISGRKGMRSLMRRGVIAVYGAVRFEFGQGYGIFRPSSVVWSR